MTLKNQACHAPFKLFKHLSLYQINIYICIFLVLRRLVKFPKI